MSHEVPGRYLWPNELNVWEDGALGMLDSPVMLVSDGFILPGHDDGGNRKKRKRKRRKMCDRCAIDGINDIKHSLTH